MGRWEKVKLGKCESQCQVVDELVWPTGAHSLWGPLQESCKMQIRGFYLKGKKTLFIQGSHPCWSRVDPGGASDITLPDSEYFRMAEGFPTDPVRSDRKQLGRKAREILGTLGSGGTRLHLPAAGCHSNCKRKGKKKSDRIPLVS